MIRPRQGLVVLFWGAAIWFSNQTPAAGQDLVVANNTVSYHESILRFSPHGESLGDFAPASFRGRPVGLAFDRAGNLYVANHANDTIHHYSITGAELGVFASVGLSGPSGVAFDSRGRLVVCNFGNGSLSIYSATGALVSHIATGLLSPIALTVDSRDNIYVSAPNIGPNSGVFRFAPDGTEKTHFATGIDFDPRGLAFDEAGNLYVADQLGNAVRRFTPEGTLLDTFARTGLSAPFALAFDAAGDLYISNQAGGTIRRYAAGGDDLGDFTVVSTPFANPLGLAFVPVPEPRPLPLFLVSAGIIRFLSRWRAQS